MTQDLSPDDGIDALISAYDDCCTALRFALIANSDTAAERVRQQLNQIRQEIGRKGETDPQAVAGVTLAKMPILTAP